MKRNSWIKGLWLTVCCAATLAAQAQQAEYRFGGAALNRDLMMAWDFSALSRTQNFGSARATAMGGAFASLGADLTAMTLNPAGLGMYRHNEVSVSPLLSVAKASTAGTQAWGSNSKTRFALADLGVAINLFEGAGKGVTSVTLGFGLNRIADFNTRYSYASDQRYNGAMVPSIADVFAQQMNQNNAFPAANPEGGPNGRLDYRNPYLWPAVLAYKSAMTHVVEDGAGNLFWEPDAIGPRASILRSVDAYDTGSINEFNFAVGANLNNIVYIGASLGIQSVHKSSTFVYGEDYGYFADGDNGLAYGPGGVLPAQLEYADLWQRTVLDGVGINFKLGVIVRPVAGLRLGVALHTPTYYSLERSYQAGLQYSLLANDPAIDQQTTESLASPVQFDEAGNSWDFTSPTRLMLGASYTFGKLAIVSVDYERNWYNGMRVKNVPNGADFGPATYKADFKENFRAVNTLRAGVEVRPLPIFALRAGCGFSSSMLRDESIAYEVPQLTTSNYFTLGAGINLSRSVSLDVAYQHLTDNQTSYRLFYSEPDPVSSYHAYASELYTTSLTRHFVTLTLGVHF